LGCCDGWTDVWAGVRRCQRADTKETCVPPTLCHADARDGLAQLWCPRGNLQAARSAIGWLRISTQQHHLPACCEIIPKTREEKRNTNSNQPQDEKEMPLRLPTAGMSCGGIGGLSDVARNRRALRSSDMMMRLRARAAEVSKVNRGIGRSAAWVGLWLGAATVRRRSGLSCPTQQPDCRSGLYLSQQKIKALGPPRKEFLGLLSCIP
jgi:hypothetical protein